MKTKNAFLALAVLFFGSAAWLQAASITQTITSINADAQKPGGPERALKSISASTHVPVATLAKEKASTGLTYGDLYIAHAIASASGKSFDQIAKLKTKGQGWDKIADSNNVSLDGKTKKKKDQVANAKSTPAPKVQVPQTPDMSGYRSMP